MLARPSWLLFAPWLLAVGLLVGPQRWKQLRIFAFFAMGLCLVMLPWWIRNARETGRFVPTTLQVGPSLFDGLHAGASGASDEGMAFMASLLALQIEEDRRATLSPAQHTGVSTESLGTAPGAGLGSGQPGASREAGPPQILLDLESVAQRRPVGFTSSTLGDQSGYFWNSIAGNLRLLVLGRPNELVAAALLDALPLLHPAAHGIRRFHTLSRASHAGSCRAGWVRYGQVGWL